MKLALAQMSMSSNVNENYDKVIKYIHQSKGADIVMFPELTLTPFFTQFKKEELKEKTGMDPDKIAFEMNDDMIKGIQAAGRDNRLSVLANLYVHDNDKYYNMSIVSNDLGTLIGKSKLVHVHNEEKFYSADYYTESEEGFVVYKYDFASVGVINSYDRHFPECIRRCAEKKCDLVIIAAANTKDEPLDMYEMELKVQAYQNNLYIAMCNRVGKEYDMDFAGQSLVVDCDGNTIYKAGDQEEFTIVDIDIDRVAKAKEERPFLELRRPDFYTKNI